MFLDIGLQVAKKITGPREDEDRDRALEYRRQDGGDHVGPVPLAAGAGGGGGAAGDGAGDGEDVEEDEEEPAEGRDEAEGEGEEDAAGGRAQEDVVAEEEDLVGVVVRVAGFNGETHLEGESVENSKSLAGRLENTVAVRRARAVFLGG